MVIINNYMLAGRVFFFPKADQFIAKYAGELPGLRVKVGSNTVQIYANVRFAPSQPRAGSYPTLTLEDENHHVQETIRYCAH